MEKIKKSITMDQDVYNDILEVAEEEDRNFSNLVNKILKEYLKKRKEQDE